MTEQLPPSPVGAAASGPVTGTGPATPEAQAVPRRRRSVQLVWIVPAIAVLIGLWLAVTSYLEGGPTVTIRLKTAEGLEAGKTKIRYKSVDIGEVKKIELAPDNKGVVVTAEMTRAAGKLMVDDTRFWIVRARVAGGQVSGLSTLLSGSYIGVDIGKSTESRRDFEGLETQPAVTGDEPGSEFLLRGGALGSLDIGSPVYYREVPVGQITAFEVDKDGKAVLIHVFVHSPYEKFVSRNTRFWHASGVDVSLDASGFKVRTQSLISILLGGIAFREPPDSVGSPQAPVGQVFRLFDDETTAMKRSDAEVTPFVAYFSESVRGLSQGAPIDFQGIVIGEVKSIDLQFDDESKNFRFPVEMNLYADRLRSTNPKYAKDKASFDSKGLMMRLIERGLRAQMRSGNLLTGQRYIALDFFPNAKPVRIDRLAANIDGLPEMPTVKGSLEELQVTLASIATKIDKVPFDEIGAELKQSLVSLQATMKHTDALVQQIGTEVVPQLGPIIADAKKTMSSAERLLASDAPIQQDLRAALRELTLAAKSLRVLTDYLESHPQSLIFGRAAEKNELEKR